MFALLAWMFAGKGPGPSAAMVAATRSSMASARAAGALPSAAYGSPAAGSALNTPTMSAPTTAVAASTSAKPASARSTPAAGASAGVDPRCASGGIVLSLFTSQASYGPATRPHFEVYAVSTAGGRCQLPFGAGSVRVVVTRHGQVVWDSATCGSPAAKPVQFQTGVPHLLTISWNRRAASPAGCAGSLSHDGAGTFDAVAMTAGQTSQVRTFKLAS